MKNEELNFDSLVKRLDLIIHLLVKPNTAKRAKTNREIIGELSERGFTDFEIAGILGKTRSYIASEITLLKKRA